MVRLPGGEDSKLLSAEVRLKEASLRLGLVSFESSSVGPADVAEQLLTVVELMRDADNCLLMGDFGATTQFGGIELEQANFRDLWAESFGKAGPESGQFVEHPGSSFPRTVASGWEQNDRFFVRSARDRIRPETVVLAPLVRAGGQRESRRRTNATMLYGLHAKVRVGTDEVRKSKTSVRGERPRHKRQNGPVLRLIRGRACNNMSDTTES